MPAPGLAATIGAGDVARLQSIPGIGKKLAERIVVECRDAAGLLAAGARPSEAAKPGDGVSAEAVSALVNLGYSRFEGLRAVDKASTPGMPLERLLRNALQGLGG
jgi:Holliday junction DNA helicase RuvA